MSQLEKDMELRVETVRQIGIFMKKYKPDRYGKYGPDSMRETARVFGRFNYDNFMLGFTGEDRRLCEVLCGPHGYSIYRALLIKRISKSRGD